MTVYKITDEESHGCTGECIRGRMSSTAEPRHADRRRSGVRKNGKDLRIRVFASKHSGEGPCLNGMSRRESVTTLEKADALAFDFRSRPLCDQFQCIHRDF